MVERVARWFAGERLMAARDERGIEGELLMVGWGERAFAGERLIAVRDERGFGELPHVREPAGAAEPVAGNRFGR